MNNYVVTNIRLLEEDYLRLKEEAAQKRKSLSAVIRDKVSGKKVSRKNHTRLLLSIKSDWFDPKELERNRKQVEEQLKKRAL